MTTLYRCKGSCQGVADQPGTCQAETCELHNQELTACVQCEPCSTVAAEDGQLHACDACKEC